MKIIFTLLYILLGYSLVFSSPVRTTFQWDHDFDNTVGFRIYYGQESGNNTFLMAEVPELVNEITINMAEQGYYVARVYNESEESESSNEVLLAAYYYNTTRFEYDSSGKILYKGEHTQQNASVDDINWVITKYYYSGNMIIQTRIRTTSWTNRSIGW